MSRTYAGILALVGMQVVLCRAIKDSAGFDGTILRALAAMVVLAAVGLVIGAIAKTTVDEAVRTRLQAELDALASTKEEQPAE